MITVLREPVSDSLTSPDSCADKLDMPKLLERPAPQPITVPSKSPARGLVRRIIACIVLGFAFVVMASVFSPDRTKAGDVPRPSGDSGSRKTRAVAPRSIDIDSDSTDPHEGLRSLGTLESRGYTIQIYATAVGPRYSIYEISTGRELGALLTVQQVNQLIPDLELPAADFSAPTDPDGSGVLMMTDPDALN